MIGILYEKSTNMIYDFVKNVISVSKSRLEYFAGSIEGFDENQVGVIVVDSLSIKIDEKTKREYLEDEQGNKYTYGDTLPDGLVDKSDQFRKKTFEELVEENESFKDRLAIAESAILDLVIGGM
ncbi:MAG: hypothetical protein ACI35R_13335 [Bacillus sp. (in: firmicutes)]